MENKLSVIVIVASATLYHLSQKSLTHGVNPWFALAFVYLVAFCASLLGALFLKGPSLDVPKTLAAGPTLFLLGVACVGIEAGYLFAYRNGGNVSSLFTQTTAGSCITLLLVGFLFFGDPVSLKSLAGLLFAAVGVLLLNM